MVSTRRSLYENYVKPSHRASCRRERVTRIDKHINEICYRLQQDKFAATLGVLEKEVQRRDDAVPLKPGPPSRASRHVLICGGRRFAGIDFQFQSQDQCLVFQPTIRPTCRRPL